MSPPPDLSNASDQEVVALALQDRQEGYSELVRRYEPTVLSNIYLIVRDGEEAKDLTQATFIKAFRALDRYDPQRSFGAWIRRIAKNTALDEIRLRKQLNKQVSTVPIEGSSMLDTDRLRRTAIQVADPGNSLPTPRARIDREKFTAALKQAIRSLPQHYRFCFVQRDIKLRSYEDIAKRLDMPTGTVRTYTHRGRKQIEEMLLAQFDSLLQSTPTPETTPTPA